MATTKELTRLVSSVAKAEFTSLGYKKRAGNIFTLDLGGDALGWVSLPHVSRGLGTRLAVTAGIGLRHEGIERFVAELCGDRFHAYLPPTIFSRIGYLMPEQYDAEWFLTTPEEVVPRIQHLVKAVQTYGVPFMRAHASLDALVAAMREKPGDWSFGFRLPVALNLQGQTDAAVRVLNHRLAAIADASYPAATDYHAFAAALGERLGSRSAIQALDPAGQKPKKPKPPSVRPLTINQALRPVDRALSVAFAGIGLDCLNSSYYAVDVEDRVRIVVRISHSLSLFGEKPTVDVYPVVAVRHEAVEDMLKVHLDDANDLIGALTMTWDLGRLMPERRFRSWEFDVLSNSEEIARELAVAVSAHGLPFARAHSSLETLIVALSRESDSVSALYRLPIALLVAGRTDAAGAALIEGEAKLAERAARGEAAGLAYASFADAVRERLPS